MANSLQIPDEAGPVAMISVRFDPGRDFRIPVEAARQPTELADILTRMQRVAEQQATRYPKVSADNFSAYALQRIPPGSSWNDVGYIKGAWDQNVKWLAEQIAIGRDTIWVYVLKNTSQPACPSAAQVRRDRWQPAVDRVSLSAG